MVRHCVRSRNLKNKEAVARVGRSAIGQKKLIISLDLSIPILLSEVYEVVRLLSFYLRLFHVQIIWLFMTESLPLKFLPFFFQFLTFFLTFYNYY